MRLLIESDYASFLSGDPASRILHYYAQQLLVECADLPTEFPFHTWQRVDDESISVNGKATYLNDGEFEYGDHVHTLLKFIGPIDTLWLQQLKANEVKCCFMCPPYGICVELPKKLRTATIQNVFPFICAATPYLATHCNRGIDHNRENMRQSGLPDDTCDLVFFSREDRARINLELEKQNVEILSGSNYKLRIRYRDSLDQLRKMPGIKIADYSRPIRLCANEDLNTAVARPVMPISGNELRGKNQTIAVADTGLDSGLNDESLHPDFQGRVKAIVSLPLNNSWSTVAVQANSNDGAADRNSGHGTHVAGLALGSGVRSSGLHQGVAPEAQLVFQAIEQYVEVKSDYRGQLESGYYLSGRPLDLGELFTQAREFGARIHVNAWGDEAHGRYTDDCYEADQFLKQNSDALVLFAAGNSGADIDGNRILDSQSLYSPASAKNVLAVGATEGGVEDIGLRVNWGAFDSKNNRFRSRTDRADGISGESQRIALFSSTGPSKDGRIKPDVCAPGTNLVAPRSRLTSQKGWGLASPLPYYMYNGGTSMAVGVAGGAAAVLREAWEVQIGQPPSGSALKALLVLSTSPVLSRRDDLSEPRHVAGFGRVQIAQALPQSQEYKITLVDERDHGMMSGDIREFPVRIAEQGDLRAVLCWYDPPGESLINNLNICLIEPTGERVWGNHPRNERGQPDSTNNVEVISVHDLPAGNYTLRVSAINIPIGPQSFALTISQSLNEGMDFPLRYLRGIGKQLNQVFEEADINRIGQLLKHPNGLDDLSDISDSVRDQLRARLSVLHEVQDLVSGITFEFEDVSLSKLLSGKQPSGFPDAEWLKLKEQCLPLVLVFNKGALSKISLYALQN